MTPPRPEPTVTPPAGRRALRARAARLLPHEWCFGAYLFCQWLRLLWAVGPLDPDAVRNFALLLANVAVIAWCEQRENAFRWRVRLWFYPIVMNVVFFMMGPAILKVAPGRCDTALRAIDETLFGAILSVRAEALATPGLTEVMSGCYLLMFPYLVLTWFAYARRDLGLFRQFFAGLFTIYGLGFLGHSLVPAAGPHLAFPGQFTAPLTGWLVTDFNAQVVARGSNTVDVFPSLHCAVTAFLLWFDRRHAPGRFRLLLLPCLGLWLATVYLRYHYFIDVAVGFLLAAFGGRVAHRWAAAEAQRQPAVTPP